MSTPTLASYLRRFFEPPAAPQKAEDWFTPGRFAFLLGLVLFASFPEVILGEQTFVIRDFGFFAYPLAYHHREAFWHGEIPLWNPLSDCGLPFMAQWNTMVFYPLSLFYLLFPLDWSLGVFCIGHMFLGGLGMYYLAHRWTGNRLAASVAGLIWAFNGLSLNCLMWTNNSSALGWMPWIVLTSEQGWLEGRRKWLLSVFCGAMQMLTGAPEIVILTWALVAGLWLGKWTFHSCPRFVLVRRFAAQVLTVAALCALQLLPFLQLLAVSQRDQGYADSTWSMPGVGWMSFLLPMFYTQPSAQGVFFQYDQYWTTSYYVGIGVFLLALKGPWRERSHRAKFLAVATIITLILALGSNGYLYHWLKAVFPPLGFFRYPIKMVVLAVFTIPLLAAFALARDLATTRTTSWRAWRVELILGAIFLLLIATTTWFAQVHPMPNDVPGKVLQNALMRGAFLTATLLVLFALAQSLAIRQRWIFQILLLLVVWFDVLTHVPRQNPTVAPFVYAPDLARLKLKLEPQPEAGKSRVMLSSEAEYTFHITTISNAQANYLSNRIGLWSNCNLLDNVPKINGFFSLYPRGLNDITSVFYVTLESDYPRLADFLGVSHEMFVHRTPKPGQSPFDWQFRPSVMPLITAGQKPLYLDSATELGALTSTNFNPREVVYISGTGKNLVTVTNETNAKVISQNWSRQQIVAEVECDSPSIVTISQTWYPAWKAYIDGSPAPLLLANHAFQAVQMPAGRHQLKLVYEDKAFYLGAIISALALLGCLAGWYCWRTAGELTSDCSSA